MFDDEGYSFQVMFVGSYLYPSTPVNCDYGILYYSMGISTINPRCWKSTTRIFSSFISFGGIRYLERSTSQKNSDSSYCLVEHGIHCSWLSA